jgi:hypothetical protein
VSDPLSLEKLQQQLQAAEAERPGETALVTLAARIRAGKEKIAAAWAVKGADPEKLEAAKRKLEALQAELETASRREQHWFALSCVTAMLTSFRAFPCVPSNARLALVIPDVVELKVRLDGTDDIPF